MSDNVLALEVRKENLPESEAIALQNSFLPFFQQAEAMKEKAMSITVTSVDQVEEIKRAREFRLMMKNIRVDCEKVRKALKEESLRKGKAIDGMANVIKFLIAPIEEHLDNQEKFVERQEQKRIEETKQKRILELAQYQVDGNNFTELGSMSDDQYALLLNGSKTQYETMLAVAKKAEADRIEREKKDAEERERMKIENENLQKKLAIEKEKADKERRLREEEENKKFEAERKLKEAKKEIKEEKKAEAAVPHARAFCAGVVTDAGEGFEYHGAKKGDLFIFLEDTPENRFAMAYLMRS